MQQMIQFWSEVNSAQLAIYTATYIVILQYII